MEKRIYDVVLLDLDGCLWPLESFNENLEKVVKKFNGHPAGEGRKAARSMYYCVESRLEKKDVESGYRMMRELEIRSTDRGEKALNEGVVELLDRLKKENINFAAVTARYGESVEYIMKKNNIFEKYFNEGNIVSSNDCCDHDEDYERLKPHKYPIYCALKKIGYDYENSGCSLKRVIFVGDGASDVRTAKNACCDSVFLGKSDHGQTYTFDNIKHFLQNLDTILWKK